MINSGIYNIRNVGNDKIYIGSAIELNTRWGAHKSLLRRNKHHSIKLQNAWNKYGKECFEFGIIEGINDKNKLIEREQNWIDFFKPEYNICKTAGNMSGVRCNEITKRKLSESLKGNKNNLGKKHTNKTKLKISIAHKGKKLSEEHKLKLSESHKGNKNSLGCKRSDETKTKISIANKGHKHTEKTKLKMKISRKGKKRIPFTSEWKKNLSIAHKGRKHTEETRRKISESKTRYHANFR